MSLQTVMRMEDSEDSSIWARHWMRGPLRPQLDGLPDAKPSLGSQANSHDVGHTPQHVFLGGLALACFSSHTFSFGGPVLKG